MAVDPVVQDDEEALLDAPVELAVRHTGGTAVAARDHAVLRRASSGESASVHDWKSTHRV